MGTDENDARSRAEARSAQSKEKEKLSLRLCAGFTGLNLHDLAAWYGRVFACGTRFYSAGLEHL
jgi:hypothetical protein